MTNLLRTKTSATGEMVVDTWLNTQCPYCGVGCGLLVGLKHGQVVKVKGDPDHPSTLGDLCLKPIHLPAALYASDRALQPLMRRNRESKIAPTSWDKAIQHVATSLLEIGDAYGPESIAFYGSGQFTTEDYYVANKLMKGFIGANNFDANSRLCMASAVAGYVSSLGSDGPPASYTDIDHADCFFLIGANMADCHPVLFNRIKRRKQSNPAGIQIIVVDPRRTRTAEGGDLHLPIRPGSDVALLNGMLHVLLKEELISDDFIANQTQGFTAMADVIAAYTPEMAAALCDIPQDDLVRAALLFGRAGNALSFWSMGVNQSTIGVQKNNAILNLHLATGQIGRPGSGPFSLTGQPNAMGGREAGGLAHLLPGYRTVTNAEHRATVERHWGAPEGSISPKPGLSAVEMFEAAAEGKIKAMWIMCTNPAVSMPNLDVVEAALRKLELLVVSDAYHPTDTSRFAHVVFPAAQWSERRGVMTNSERRLTYLAHIVKPAGEALPDWQIISKVASAMGFAKEFRYTSSEAIFDEFKALTQGRPCDYSGVSYARLKRDGPLQWPVPAATHAGTERLYTAQAEDAPRFRTATGKANFIATQHQEIYEKPSADFPLILTSGRLKNQWHTMTRTGKSPSLLKEAPEPFLEIHPQDATQRQIENGDLVEIKSRRGSVRVKAVVTPKIRPGACFLPFHWGRMAGHHQATNNLTTGAFDPVSKEPELKACAVQVTQAAHKRIDLKGMVQRFVQLFDGEGNAHLEPVRMETAVANAGE